MLNRVLHAAERGSLPDGLIRWGIRRLCADRLRGERRRHRRDPEIARRFVEDLERSPVAVEQDSANAQHYEVPPEFFELVLGPRLKYSCCSWPSRVNDLASAEEEMLSTSCQRAQIEDGMKVLDLGCGWGSMSLWIAERYPSCEVLAISNSTRQKCSIDARCRKLGIDNVRVETHDVAGWEGPGRRFDRVVSIEMFEHMRNWAWLLRRVAGWLEPDGKIFLHYFSHRRFAYLYEATGPSDWMAREFFTGGMMPSDSLVRELGLAGEVDVEHQWSVSGTHYERTSNAWLDNLDAHREPLLEILTQSAVTSGGDGSTVDPELLLQRWRIFFMACAELFGFRHGEEWWVSHVRLAPSRKRRVEDPGHVR